ncbi:unnamed protein product [Amoebophrya sp. A120]|nr:unnamed protein product [Amoebophrya sp. A120]|eukprot:GSA120T00004290001.1
MPFVTETLIPSGAVLDGRVPRFHSLHTQDIDFQEFGSRMIYALRKGMSEEELMEMLMTTDNLRAGPYSSDFYSKLYEKELHLQDKFGRTLLHYAIRYNMKVLSSKILELNAQHYLDPMKAGKRGKFGIDSMVAGGFFREDDQLENDSTKESEKQLLKFLDSMVKDYVIEEETAYKPLVLGAVERYKKKWAAANAQDYPFMSQILLGGEQETSNRTANSNRGASASSSSTSPQHAATVVVAARDHTHHQQQGQALHPHSLESEKTLEPDEEDAAGGEGTNTKHGRIIPAGAPDVDRHQDGRASEIIRTAAVSGDEETLGGPQTREVEREDGEIDEARKNEIEITEADYNDPKRKNAGGNVDVALPQLLESDPMNTEGTHAAVQFANTPLSTGRKNVEIVDKNGGNNNEQIGQTQSEKNAAPSPASALSPSKAQLMKIEVDEMKVFPPEFEAEDWRKELDEELQEYRDLLVECEGMWQRRQDYNVRIRKELAPPPIPTLDELLLDAKSDWPKGTRFKADVVAQALKNTGGTDVLNQQLTTENVDDEDDAGVAAAAPSSPSAKMLKLLNVTNTNSNSPTMRKELDDLQREILLQEQENAKSVYASLTVRKKQKIYVNLLEVEDFYRQTPIIEASKLGRKAIFDMLVSAGAHINYDDGDEDVADQLFELSALRNVFYNNSLGTSEFGRRIGDMQLSVDDWQQDQKYSQIFHKLEREIGVLYGRGGESSNQTIASQNKLTTMSSEQLAELRPVELDPDDMILNAPDITESIKLQAIKEEQLRREEEERKQEKLRRLEERRLQREAKQRQIEEELEAAALEQDKLEQERLELERQKAAEEAIPEKHPSTTSNFSCKTYIKSRVCHAKNGWGWVFFLWIEAALRAQAAGPKGPKDKKAKAGGGKKKK